MIVIGARKRSSRSQPREGGRVAWGGVPDGVMAAFTHERTLALARSTRLEEGDQEGGGQGGDLDNRLQTGACDLPEQCPGKLIAPEDLPASDGASVDAETVGEVAETTWCRPLPHGADKDDEGGDEDPSSEEANRRRCHSLPAAVAIAAEAQSDALWLGYLIGITPRLPRIVGSVQASTTGTPLLAGGLRKILVDCKKERPKPGVARQILIHGRVLRGCETPRSIPLGNRDRVIRLSEGYFLDSLSEAPKPPLAAPSRPVNLGSTGSGVVRGSRLPLAW